MQPITFSNFWNANYGFTPEEAEKKAKEVNKERKVDDPNSIWKPAVWIPDRSKKMGYKVVLEMK